MYIIICDIYIYMLAAIYGYIWYIVQLRRQLPMWPVWHRPQPPVETAEPSPAFFGPALRGRWRKYSSTVLDTYVAWFFLNRSQYILIYTVYIISYIYIYFVVLDIHDYIIVYVCLIICVHSCFFVDDLANLEAEQDTESFKVLPASLGLRPRYTSWRNWLLSYECRRDMLYRAVNKSRHVQPLMITVRNTQKLWTSVTNSYFYTTASSLFVSSMWLFTLISKIMRKTWSYLISSLTRRHFSSLSISVSNHSIDFEWPLWAFGAWGCTQQGQAVYVPGSVVELSGQMRAESDIVWHRCSLLSVCVNCVKVSSAERSEAWPFTKVRHFCICLWAVRGGHKESMWIKPVAVRHCHSQTFVFTTHNFCAFQDDHRRFTVRIFPKLLPDTEFGDSFTLKMDEYGLQMFANVCMICMVQVQWLQCPTLSTAAWILVTSQVDANSRVQFLPLSLERRDLSLKFYWPSKEQETTWNKKNRRWMERRDWRSPLLVRSHWKETSRGVRTMKNPAGKLPR